MIYVCKSQGHYLISSREPTRGANRLDSISTPLSSWEYIMDVLDPVIADHDCPVVIEVNLDEMAWDLVNWTCKNKSAMKLSVSLDVFNSFILGEVDRLVRSLPSLPDIGSSTVDHRKDLFNNFVEWEPVCPSAVVKTIQLATMYTGYQ
ncbi:hypothetical protein J6590_026240 [Homalodisca vitripennis]|nr:hypothetical protein J6590_026240 [Homalodisca vitripennis]